VRGSDNFEWTTERSASAGTRIYILAEHDGFLEHQEPFSQFSFPISPWEVIDPQYVNLVESSNFGSRVVEFIMGFNAIPQVRIKAKGGGGNSGTRVTFDTDPEPWVHPLKSGIAQFPFLAGFDFSGQKIWSIKVRSFKENQEIALQMRGEALLEDGSTAVTGWVPYLQDITQLRFHWWPSSSPSAGDGGILIAHGDEPITRATGLHILPNDLDEVHMGLLEPVTELNGRLHVDNFNLTTGVEPPQLVPLSAEGGEAGRLRGWTIQNPHLVNVTTAAAHNGNHGIEFDLNGTTSNIYLADVAPVAERHLRIRFDFDPSNVVHPQGNAFSLVTAWDAGKSTPVLRARFLTITGGYALQVLAWDDSGTPRSLPWIQVATDDWSDLEIQWWASSGFAVADGGLRLWVNGEKKAERLDLMNSSDLIYQVDLGARGLDAGTDGILHIDNYELRY